MQTPHPSGAGCLSPLFTRSLSQQLQHGRAVAVFLDVGKNDSDGDLRTSMYAVTLWPTDLATYTMVKPYIMIFLNVGKKNDGDLRTPHMALTLGPHTLEPT